MGVTVLLDADYEVSFPVGSPQEGAMKITAHEVESIEEFCVSPLGTKKVWEMQLGKMNARLMRLLREVAKPSPGKSLQEEKRDSLASWRFLFYNEQGEKVWLKAVRS